MSTIALIVAAGRGTRAGGGHPKQYRNIRGRSILTRTLEAMLAHPEVAQALVVIHPDDNALYQAALGGLDRTRILPAVLGGQTRSASVRRGLEALLSRAPSRVLIHDAARPFVSAAIIGALMDALNQSDGAFPVVPVADALWEKDNLVPVDRSALVRAQTPQAFDFNKILEAHTCGSKDALDDVEVAIGAGLTVAQIPGEERNFKVTTAEDLERAERMVSSRFDVRTGTGFDVHAFTGGDHVILNGISIPFSRGLKGHSDADVSMHAITDAIYGALAEGDIGRWFPPSDAQWKGAASDIFLRHACGRAAERGFRISHIDCAIICEEPKIGPHAEAMRNELSTICGIETGRVSVKATTSEKLGFTGRGEGIAALATVTLVTP